MTEMGIDTPSGRSTIFVGRGVEGLDTCTTGATRKIIVTDVNVRAAYGHRFPSWPVVTIGTGEGSKTLATVETVYEEFVRHELDRSSFVLGIGGGVVCDLAGFAASTFMRGLPFGFIATTLLAQVDASVGGKNGVNFKGYKNLVGTFTQPRFVWCDLEALQTLPREELTNGLAEVVKHGLIGDARLFSYLENNWAKLLSLETGAMEYILRASLRVKSGFVAMDEREEGERRKLNFGHTIGHAIEKVCRLRHGEAVSVGMVAAAKVSAARKLLTEREVTRIEELLTRLGLPVRVEGERDGLHDALMKDKKREGSRVHLVLLDRIGTATTAAIDVNELRGVLDDLRQPC